MVGTPDQKIRSNGFVTGGVAGAHDFGFGQTALLLAGFAGQKMPGAGRVKNQLAGTGFFEPFGGGLAGFSGFSHDKKGVGD
jgi:hypothetical protein